MSALADCRKGDAALRRGAWAEARDAFAAALSGKETAEALEGFGHSRRVVLASCGGPDTGLQEGDSMKTLVTVVAAAALVLGGTLTGAHAQGSQHVIATPAEAQWGPAPPLVPPGAQIAVLAGDPTKPAAYTVRLKFPPNYAIPAHSHPADEHVVLVSGALTLGMGDKLDKKAPGNKTLTAGSFALMPAGMNHFAYTGKHGASILLYGQGPIDFKYVNPADDPRNAPKAGK
ncbi:MAG TPA: cupin domain-containing protein [Thermoanaerobaculia bacterium]|nr:cupin domain-containing protein [Thermoanaerobaculia bacterium]